uniref:Uncharacterized protein n=1 Tax=Pithovirus LCPAC403 TaxID=2506596 RepID=A0A481ZC45_9VIRU|nr:MAG: uncharacterized protein LCPAC403_00460 [Pithovirus LCPAC403]
MIKEGETIVIDPKAINHIKSKLTHDTYMIPIVLKGRKEGILESRLMRCICGKISKSSDEVVFPYFHIETSGKDQQYGKIRGLLCDDKKDEALDILEEYTFPMGLYLRAECSGDSRYLILALSGADNRLKTKILCDVGLRNINNKTLAWETATAIGVINQDGRFNEGKFYFLESKSKYDELVHITAFYVDEISEGRKACDRIMLNPLSTIKHLAIQNLKFYAEKIPSEMTLINPKCAKFYNPTNPSIIKSQEGYTMICRTVNYVYKDKQWISQDGTGIIRTVNLLLQLDSNLNILSSDEIEVKADYKKGIVNTRIIGHEDCRLFKHNDELWYTCTSLDTNFTGLHQISLCKLEGSDVVKLVPLLYKNNHVQKNWCPYSSDGKIYIVYGYEPLTILEVNEDTGVCIPLKGFRGLQTKYFRGSTGPIPYKDGRSNEGWLMMIHNTEVRERVYLQRFIWLDSNMIMRYISTSFYFKESNGVEFPLGLCTDGNNIIVSFGVNDKSTWIARIKGKVVNRFVFIDGHRV